MTAARPRTLPPVLVAGRDSKPSPAACAMSATMPSSSDSTAGRVRISANTPFRQRTVTLATSDHLAGPSEVSERQFETHRVVAEAAKAAVAGATKEAPNLSGSVAVVDVHICG